MSLDSAKNGMDIKCFVVGDVKKSDIHGPDTGQTGNCHLLVGVSSVLGSLDRPTRRKDSQITFM